MSNEKMVLVPAQWIETLIEYSEDKMFFKKGTNFLRMATAQLRAHCSSAKYILEFNQYDQQSEAKQIAIGKMLGYKE